MKSNLFTGELTWKGILGVLALAAGAVGIFYTGNILYHQIQSRPKSVAAIKHEIFSFLKEKTGNRDLAVNLKAVAAKEVTLVSNELVTLHAEIPPLQTNLAALQSVIRTNREEAASANLELRRLKRQAGILPLRNRPAATVAETNQLAAAAETTTNLSSTIQQTNNPSIQPPFDLAAASLTNEAFKVIFEKDKALTTKQAQVAALQKELNALAFKLNSRQKAIVAREKELKALQSGTGIETKLARQCQQQIQEAMSWELLYKAFSQELWLSDLMLASTNLEMRQSGLQLADQVRAQAMNTAENGWLACRIIEGFIWPNLALADNPSGNAGTRDQLLTSAGLTFQQSGETNNYIKNSEMLIAQSKNPVKADFARYRLANTLEMMGNYEAALVQLRAIQSSNSLVYAAKRIPVIEGKLKYKRKK